jgi:hypothetical protein
LVIGMSERSERIINTGFVEAPCAETLTAGASGARSESGPATKAVQR